MCVLGKALKKKRLFEPYRRITLSNTAYQSVHVQYRAKVVRWIWFITKRVFPYHYRGCVYVIVSLRAHDILSTIVCMRYLRLNFSQVSILKAIRWEWESPSRSCKTRPPNLSVSVFVTKTCWPPPTRSDLVVTSRELNRQPKIKKT